MVCQKTTALLNSLCIAGSLRLPGQPSAYRKTMYLCLSFRQLFPHERTSFSLLPTREPIPRHPADEPAIFQHLVKHPNTSCSSYREMSSGTEQPRRLQLSWKHGNVLPNSLLSFLPRPPTDMGALRDTSKY